MSAAIASRRLRGFVTTEEVTSSTSNEQWSSGGGGERRVFDLDVVQRRRCCSVLESCFNQLLHVGGRRDGTAPQAHHVHPKRLAFTQRKVVFACFSFLFYIKSKLASSTSGGATWDKGRGHAHTHGTIEPHWDGGARVRGVTGCQHTAAAAAGTTLRTTHCVNSTNLSVSRCRSQCTWFLR